MRTPSLRRSIAAPFAPARDGQSLIEVMVALGILAILLLAIMQFTSHSYQTQSYQRKLTNQHRVMRDLSKLVGMPGALRNSFPGQLNTPGVFIPRGNYTLESCANGAPGPCDTSGFQPFVLYGPQVVASAGGITSIHAGAKTGYDPASALLYDIHGYACSVPGGKCVGDSWVFSAYTELALVCPPKDQTAFIGDGGTYLGTAIPGSTLGKTTFLPESSCNIGLTGTSPAGSIQSVEGGIEILVRLTVATVGSSIPAYQITVPTWLNSVQSGYFDRGITPSGLALPPSPGAAGVPKGPINQPPLAGTPALRGGTASSATPPGATTAPVAAAPAAGTAPKAGVPALAPVAVPAVGGTIVRAAGP